MNAEHILDAMGLLDDDLIQEAEAYTLRKQRMNYGKWLGWAASFAVVLALGYGLTHGIRMGGGNAAPSGGAAGEPSSSAGMEAPPPGAASASNGGGTPSIPEGTGNNGYVGSGGPAGEGPYADPGLPLSPSDGTGENDRHAAIMVDGVLYWSTETPVPGEVDESVIRTVTSYTDGQPEEDGQTNFDQSLTTQYAMTDMGLVVLMDNEWVLFDPVPPWEG